MCKCRKDSLTDMKTPKHEKLFMGGQEKKIKVINTLFSPRKIVSDITPKVLTITYVSVLGRPCTIQSFSRASLRTSILKPAEQNLKISFFFTVSVVFKDKTCIICNTLTECIPRSSSANLNYSADMKNEKPTEVYDLITPYSG